MLIFDVVSKLELQNTDTITPAPLVAEMLDRLPADIWSDPTRTFIDLAGGTGTFAVSIILRLNEGLRSVIPDAGTRLRHIMAHQVHYNDISPQQVRRYRAALRRLGIEQWAQNTYNFDALAKEWHMKFDVVVGNPPYQGTLCLKFLHQACDVGHRIIYVMPTTWLLDNKGVYAPYIKTRNAVKNRLKSVTLFNGNEDFGIGSFLPLGILDIGSENEEETDIKVIDRCNDTTLSYKNIDVINKFSDVSTYPILAEKYKKISEQLGHAGLHINSTGKYYINFSPIRGHVNSKGNVMVADDFYTIIPRNTIIDSKITKKKWWSFDTESEARNFLYYIKTDFVRFGLAICKNTQNLNTTDLSCIPWLDFSKSWTDEDLYRKFNITPEEQKFIQQHIPKYY